MRGPAYADGQVEIYQGDALAVLRELPGDSVDCIVTSAPVVCSKLVHRGGRYSRLEGSLAMLCHNCGELIDDVDRLGVVLT